MSVGPIEELVRYEEISEMQTTIKDIPKMGKRLNSHDHYKCSMHVLVNLNRFHLRK